MQKPRRVRLIKNHYITCSYFTDALLDCNENKQWTETGRLQQTAPSVSTQTTLHLRDPPRRTKISTETLPTDAVFKLLSNP